MATKNPTITATAAKLVDASTAFFLSLPWKSQTTLLWATTDTPGQAPTVAVWHPLRGPDGDKLSRDLIGNDLEVCARCPDGSVTVAIE